MALLEEERWVIEPPDVVKGMSRLTLTLPALTRRGARCSWSPATAKREALARIGAGEPLPAGLVRDAEWLVDKAAALA